MGWFLVFFVPGALLAATVLSVVVVPVRAATALARAAAIIAASTTVVTIVGIALLDAASETEPFMASLGLAFAVVGLGAIAVVHALIAAVLFGVARRQRAHRPQSVPGSRLAPTAQRPTADGRTPRRERSTVRDEEWTVVGEPLLPHGRPRH